MKRASNSTQPMGIVLSMVVSIFIRKGIQSIVIHVTGLYPKHKERSSKTSTLHTYSLYRRPQPVSFRSEPPVMRNFKYILSCHHLSEPLSYTDHLNRTLPTSARAISQEPDPHKVPFRGHKR